jgi:pimeloyl-ACP methyl ester carboxylesterase
MPPATWRRSRTGSASSAWLSKAGRVEARTRSHARRCLPDRVVAAASLAGVAPYPAEGLDWLQGMGQDNLDEFAATLAGRDQLERFLKAQAEAMLDADPEALAETLRSLLSPPDAAVCTGEVAEYILAATSRGIQDRLDGWIDDDFAFLSDWGFDLGAIEVPVQLWHGEEDRFVPIAHGWWLAQRIRGVDARLLEGEGHLTIQLGRIGDVHAWLVEHF